MVRGITRFLAPPGEGQSSRGTSPLQRRAEAAWLLRWRVIMACSAAKAFALSLLESQTCAGSDGSTPMTEEVIGDFRYEPAGE